MEKYIFIAILTRVVSRVLHWRDSFCDNNSLDVHYPSYYTAISKYLGTQYWFEFKYFISSLNTKFTQRKTVPRKQQQVQTRDNVQAYHLLHGISPHK